MKKIVVLMAVVYLAGSFKQKGITWVAIGDSITYLNEHKGETGDRVTKGYLTRVTEQLPAVHYINQGHNGWTSGDIADSIDVLGLVKADIYSVFLGTNDWWYGRNLGIFSDYTGNKGNGTVYGSFRIIINKIRTLNPAAKIILITPMQRVDFVSIYDMTNNAYGSYREKKGQLLEQFAKAVDSIGKYEKIQVVDLFHTPGMGLKSLVRFKRLRDPKTQEYKNYKYPDFIDVPFNPGKDKYPYPPAAAGITFDGLHPSDKGYKIISGLLVKAIGK